MKLEQTKTIRAAYRQLNIRQRLRYRRNRRTERIQPDCSKRKRRGGGTHSSQREEHRRRRLRRSTAKGETARGEEGEVHVYRRRGPIGECHAARCLWWLMVWLFMLVIERAKTSSVRWVSIDMFGHRCVVVMSSEIQLRHFLLLGKHSCGAFWI